MLITFALQAVMAIQSPSENAAPQISAAQISALQIVAPQKASAGQHIQIETLETISSETARPGQRFRIRLHAPILVGDQVFVPEGVEGEGEVLDAAPRGFMGAAGKLVLVARYLRVGDRQIRLRGMLTGGAGQDNTKLVVVVGAISPLGSLLVQGGNYQVPAGQVLDAKLGEDVSTPIEGQARPDPGAASPTPAEPSPANPSSPLPAPATNPLPRL